MITSVEGYQAWQYQFALDRLKEAPHAVIDNVAILVGYPCFEENRRLHKRVETKLIKGMPLAEAHLLDLMADNTDETLYSMMEFFAREVNKLKEGGFAVDYSENFKRQLMVMKLKEA